MNSQINQPIQSETTPRKAKAVRGASDVLGFFYGLWAFSALGRSSWEYLFKQNVRTYAPAHLSTFVGLLYIFIIVGLHRRTPRWWWITLGLLTTELAGVLIVGTIDVVWHPFHTRRSGRTMGSAISSCRCCCRFSGWHICCGRKRARGTGCSSR